MSYIGSEDTQKEAEFFSDADRKDYHLVCITGDLDRKLGWALNYAPEDEDPIYLATARGDFRMFKTVDAAVNLMMSKNIMMCEFWFDPR